MSKKKNILDNTKRQRISDRVLILTLFVQVLILVNQSIGIYAVATQSMQASMIEPTGEKLEIHIDTDTGRPRDILDHIERYLQGQQWFTSSWLGAWRVGGVERTDATVAINITVTGSNVLSTATVDYWVEGRPIGGGQPFKLLQATGAQVTVGGAALQASSNLGITAHLEAMSLATDQSWTVDYYVYVNATTTGAVSGEALTSEITETKFDTKTYEHYDPGTWTAMTSNLVNNHGIVRHSDGSWWGGTSFLRVGGTSLYANYWHIRTTGLDGTPTLPYATPGSLVIHEAYLRIKTNTVSSNGYKILIHMYDHHAWQDNYITGYSGYTDTYMWRYGNRLPWNVTWTLPNVVANQVYDSPDISPFIQYLVDRYAISDSSIRGFVFFLEPEGSLTSQVYNYHMSTAAPCARLYVRWSQYSASWYPLPPLSLAELPITIDVVAMTALIIATLFALRENRRKNR